MQRESRRRDVLLTAFYTAMASCHVCILGLDAVYWGSNKSVAGSIFVMGAIEGDVFQE
jgi:hypothetical protein